MARHTLNGLIVAVEPDRKTEIADYLEKKGLQVAEITVRGLIPLAYIRIPVSKSEFEEKFNLLKELEKKDFRDDNDEANLLPY